MLSDLSRWLRIKYFIEKPGVSHADSKRIL